MDLTDIRNQASQWNLEGDAQILKQLEAFANRLQERTREIDNQFKQLVSKTQTSQTQLGNVTNQFLLLHNTQFIESRVNDDSDPEPEKLDSQELTEEQRESEITRKMTDALGSGIIFMETSFERVEFDHSDSEDEETSPIEPIFEAKNRYQLRTLPYIIGTQKFMTEDKIGLSHITGKEDDDNSNDSEVSEDEAEEEPPAQPDNDVESEYSDSDDEERVQRSPQPAPLFIDSGSDSESSLFGTPSKPKPPPIVNNEVSEEEESEDQEEEQPKRIMSFTDELAQKLGGSAAPPPIPKTKKPKKEARVDDLFESALAVEEPAVTPKPKVEPASLFDYDEEDDEDDLFSAKPTVAQKQPDVNASKKPTPNDTMAPAVVPPSKKHSSFFDSDSEEEEIVKKPPVSKGEAPPKPDDKVDAPLPPVVPPATKKPAPKKSSLFDDSDEDDDLFSKPKPSVAPAKKAPFGGVSILAAPMVPKKELEKEEEPKPKMTKPAKDLFNDSDSDGDLFSSSSKQPKETKLPPPVAKVPNLFASDSEDDDQDIFFKTKAPPQKKSVHKEAKETKKEAPAKGRHQEVQQKDVPRAVIESPMKKEAKKEAPKVHEEKIKETNGTTQAVIESHPSEHEDPQPLSEEPKSVVADSKPISPIKRRPAGAVSMFGNFDPSAILGKKKPADEDVADGDESSDKASTNPATPTPIFDAVSPVRSSAPARMITSDSEYSTTDPLSEDARPAALVSITKARPKVGGARRRQTRQARLRSAEASVSESEPDAGGDQVRPVEEDVDKIKVVREEAEVPEPKEVSVDVQEPSQEAAATAEVDKSDQSFRDRSLSPDDLMAPPPMPEDIQKNKDPIFGSLSSDEDDLFKPKATPVAVKANDLFESDDEELFAAPRSVTKEAKKDGKKNEPRSLFDDLEDDDDDDLFSSLSKK